MAFPDIAERKQTRSDLMALYDLPENADKTFELLNGVIYNVPRPFAIHNWIAFQIARLLGNFVVERGLGSVFPDGNQFELPNGDTLIPDAAFVSNETFTGVPSRYHTVAPDLAVEVMSPSNEPVPTIDKVRSYLENGTKRVWVIYPETRSVNVFRLQADGSIAFNTFRHGDTLSGEDVLPGFTLSVADLFPAQSQQPDSGSRP